MIAQVKRPREWTFGDWLGMVSLIGTLMAGAWWMSAQNSLLTSVLAEVGSLRRILVEQQKDQKEENIEIWTELRSQDRRLLMQENKRE